MTGHRTFSSWPREVLFRLLLHSLRARVPFRAKRERLYRSSIHFKCLQQVSPTSLRLPTGITYSYAALVVDAWCCAETRLWPVHHARSCPIATLPLHEQYPARGYDDNDPSLRTGEGGLTVWDLK